MRIVSRLFCHLLPHFLVCRSTRHRKRWSKQPHRSNWVSRRASSRVSIFTKWPPKVIARLKSLAIIFKKFITCNPLVFFLLFCFYYLKKNAGYVSFVRSYAALPKDVRDIFNFQSLHLGHYAKSFALRDPPAQINSAGRSTGWNEKAKPFNTARQRKALKRAALG